MNWPLKFTLGFTAAAVELETITMHDVGADRNRVSADGFVHRIGEPPVAAAGVIGIPGKGTETEATAIEGVAVKGRESADIALAGGIDYVDVFREAYGIPAESFSMVPVL